MIDLLEKIKKPVLCGETMTMSELSDILKIRRSSIQKRFDRSSNAPTHIGTENSGARYPTKLFDREQMLKWSDSVNWSRIDRGVEK